MNLRPGKPLFRACRSALSSSKLLVFLVTAALALGVVPSQLVSEATAASTDPSDGETTSSAAPKSNPMEIPTPPTVTEIPEDFPTEAAVAEATKTAPEAPTGPVNRDPMPVMRVDPDNPDSVALDQAQRTGKKVEILSKRTETETTFANPQGTLTTELSSGPIRVKKGDSLVPIDTALEVTDVGISPKAAPGEITMSNGGAEGSELVAIGAKGRAHFL